MELTDQHFQLCRIFVDETKIEAPTGALFVIGALLMPVDCDLQPRLGASRKKIRFLHTLHFSDRLDTKSSKFARALLDDFLSSSACFRAIVADTSQWKGIAGWRDRARLTGLLLAYPWMPAEDKIFKVLSRARVIFDRISLSGPQQAGFLNELNRMIKKGLKKSDPAYPIEPAALVFADKKIFDELQLTDVITGIVRVSYLQEYGVKVQGDKKAIHDSFLADFTRITSFKGAAILRPMVKSTFGILGRKVLDSLSEDYKIKFPLSRPTTTPIPDQFTPQNDIPTYLRMLGCPVLTHSRLP